MKGLDEIAQKKAEFITRSCGTAPNTMRIGVGIASAMAESLAMLGHGHIDSEGRKLTDDVDIFRDLCLSGGEIMGLRFKVDFKEPAEFIELTWQDRPSFFQYSQAGIPIGDYDTARLRRQRDEATVAANPERFPLSMQSEGVRLGEGIKRINQLEEQLTLTSQRLNQTICQRDEARTQIADLKLERDHLREQVQEQATDITDLRKLMVESERLDWLLGRIVDHQGTPAVQVILGVTHDQFLAAAKARFDRDNPGPTSPANFNGTCYDVIKDIIDEKRKVGK